MILIYSKASDGNMLDLKTKSNFLAKFKNVAQVKQVHGNKIVLADRANVCADGIVTNKKGIYLVIKTADCIPISFYDPITGSIGLIHAGLKGLQKNIIKSAVNKMKKLFDVKTKNLIVKIGPSIGPCHYKTDIWQEAEKQLIGCKIKNIDNPKICTYENKDYFSHRRSQDLKTEEGRFVTILGLKNVN